MKTKKKLPVSVEFSFVSLGIITIILIVYTIIQLISFSIFSIGHQNDLIEKTYSQINLIFENKNIQKDKNQIKESMMKLTEKENIRIYKDNDLLFSTNSSNWKNIKLNMGSDNKETKNIKFIKFRPYVLLDGPMVIDGYRIQILQETDILTDFIENYLHIFLLAVVLSVVLSIIGSIYLSKKFISRLNTLTDTMSNIKQNNINSRVELSGTNDEFDKMNILFNSMMDDIEESFEKQSQFVSDASHELRTPLTVLQGHLKMLSRWGKNDKEVLDNSINVCLEEVNRMIKMVNGLLSLSRVDKEIINIAEVEEIYPKDIIFETIENYKILNNKIDFKVNIDEMIKLKISKEHLKQLLIIMIDNAIKYNDKGVVKIEVELDLNKNQKCLVIKDNGIGIDEKNIYKVTDRFYKVDESRQKDNSFGLGLSIAKKIISLYQGSLSIQSKIKEYTKIIIKFN